MPVYMVVRGGQRPMLVSSSITLLTFVVSLLRIVISLNSEINNSITLADPTHPRDPPISTFQVLGLPTYTTMFGFVY